MTMPNFLIIGAVKAGTTSLYHYLDQHPQVFMSPTKEPMFFAVDYDRPLDEGLNRFAITNIEAYRALFADVTDQRAVGEASPQYLWSPLAPGRIREHVPAVKLIAGLRNPVDRAYSSFLHLVREGVEPIRDFSEALEQEEARIRSNLGPLWRYKEVGLYAAQLERYFAIFDRSQIRIYLYEDLSGDPVGLVQDIFRFIGCKDTLVPDVSKRHNVSGVPRSRRLHALLRGRHPGVSALTRLVPTETRGRFARWLQNRNMTSVQRTVPPAVRTELVRLCREDILRTQDLIQRDLSKWLE